MGCVEDDFDLENISFSDTDTVQRKDKGILKSKTNKKNNKKKKKSKNKNKKVTFAPSAIASKKKMKAKNQTMKKIVIPIMKMRKRKIIKIVAV